MPNVQGDWRITAEVWAEAAGGLSRVFACEDRPAKSQVTDRRPPVWAVNADLEPAARLYAALTGRSYGGLWTLQGGQESGAAIIVSLYDGFTSKLVDDIVAVGQAHGLQPGLLLAHTPDGLLRQVAQRAAALQAKRIPVDLAIRMSGDAAISTYELPRLRLLGAQASTDQVQEALTSAAQLTVLSTHSDGLDLKLSNETTLCSLPEHAFEGYWDRPNPPRCVSAQFCHRKQGPLVDPLTRASLMAADDITTGILIADACSVLPVLKSADKAASLGAKLIEAPAIGAVAFNCEVYPGDMQRAWQLSAALEQGTPLGKAIAAFNSATHRRISRRMMFVGDPELAFTAHPQAEPIAVEANPEPLSAHTNLVPRAAELAFMRRCIANRPHARRHLKALHALEPDAATERTSAPNARLAVLQAIAAHLRAFSQTATRFPQTDWLAEAVLVDADAAMECFSCGANMRTYRAHFGPTSLERCYGHCPECNAFMDRPELADFSLVARPNGEIDIVAKYQDLPVGARFFAHAPFAQGRAVQNWPRTQDGHLAAQSVAPPREAWICGILVSWGVQFAAAAAPTRWWRARP